MCGNCCAGLVAYSQNTLFENCENTANIKGIFWGSDSAYAITGGIAALSNNCIFKDCTNSGQIESFAYSNKESVSVAGGISGQANNSIFYSCYNNSTLFPSAFLDECDNPTLCSACSGGISGVVENSVFLSCIGNAARAKTFKTCYNIGNTANGVMTDETHRRNQQKSGNDD